MAPSNQDDFDGYRKWLGITNKKRPPTHYELLKISLDEDDPEVIRAAVEQRRHYVESKRGDGHDSVVSEILYRIGEAEATLLNDEMRRDYDRRLNLFEKRRKNRQVDPNAARSRVVSQPGRTVGEDSGIVRTFAGIMAVICVCFGVMAWFSFQLPWSKPTKQAVKQAELPVAVAPVAQVPVVAPPVQVVQVSDIVVADPKPDQVEAQPVAEAPEKATKEEAALMFSAIDLTIGADGSGKLTVDSRDPMDIKAEESKGKSFKILALGDAEAFSESDGRLRVLYDFSKFKALDQLKGPWLTQDEMTLFKQISIDADEKALVFNPGSLGKVRLRFPRSVLGPLNLKVLLKGASEGVIQLQLGNGQDVLIVSLHGKNSPENETAGTVLATLKTGSNFNSLIRASQPVAQKKEFDFKVKPTWIQERTAILVAYLGDVPIAIPRLEVTAKMIPSFGVGLAQKGKRLFAEKVMDGGAGAAAGIKAGDTILRINNKATDDVAGAMKLLSESPLETEAVFEIERFEKKQTINVTPK